MKEKSNLPESVRGGFSSSENKIYKTLGDDDSKPISPLQSYSSKGFRIKPKTEQSQQRLQQHSSKDRELQEKQKIMEKLRDKYLPLDFESIKEHERTFLANAYVKKAQREQELKQKLKQQELAYKLPQVSGATKTYQAMKEEYHERRGNGSTLVNKKQLESMESRERMKKYTEKLRTMNLLDERVQLARLSGAVNGQLPSNTPTSSKGESVYGRFGREWEKKLNQDANERKYQEEVREKGNEYLQIAKSKASKKESVIVEESPPLPTEPTPHEQAKLQREKGNEYLKFARSMAAKQRDTPHLPNNESSRAAVLSRVERTEAEVMSMERKVKLNPQTKDGREVEDAYLKSIKAKLDLLDAI
jgi:hypothetical protein